MDSLSHKKRSSGRRGVSLKAQMKKQSCSNNSLELAHLSTSNLSDKMAKHLIGALVMKSLIQLEREAS